MQKQDNTDSALWRLFEATAAKEGKSLYALCVENKVNFNTVKKWQKKHPASFVTLEKMMGGKDFTNWIEWEIRKLRESK